MIFEKLFKTKEKADTKNIDNGVLKTIQSVIGDAHMVFDIGACYGRYSQEVKTVFPHAKIHCFEPFPEAYNTLKNNFKNDESVIINNLAVSNFNGSSSFYVNNLHETNSLIPSAITDSSIDKLTQNRDVISVPVISLDQYTAERAIGGIDILKIDVQGNTYAVLEGATGLLQNRKIKCIQCEVEFIEIYKAQKLYHEVALLLYNSGYELYSFFHLHHDINGRASWADAIFILKDNIR